MNTRLIARLADARIVAALLSMAISMLTYMRNEPINYDALGQYLSGAYDFINSGLTAAMYHTTWPLYSILIAEISQLCGISLLHAAFSLNLLLNVLIAIAFVNLMMELNASRMMAIAAMITLFAFHAYNGFRSNIIRDFGYWAFLLFSVTYLLRFSKDPTWKNSFIWSFCIWIATLFRIEGGFLLLTMPLAFVFLNHHSWLERAKLFLRSHVFNFGLIAFLLCWFLLLPHHHLHHYGRLSDFFNQTHGVIRFISESLQKRVQVLSPFYSYEQAKAVIIFGTVGYFIEYFVYSFGVLYVLLACFGMTVKQQIISSNDKKLLLFFAFLALLPSFLFYLQGWGLSGRYYMGGCFLLSVWVAVALIELSFKWVSQIQHWKKVLISLIGIWIFVSSVSTVIPLFGPSKAYITQAGLWAKLNIPADKSVLSNDPFVLYYAGRFNLSHPNEQAASDNTIVENWHHYDYVMVKVKSSETEFLRKLGHSPIKIFSNRHGDHISIYATR